MIGAGTIINPIIKVVTTVAILAAVYFFFVKPALDTTESITDTVNKSISQGFGSFDGAFEEAESVGVDIDKPKNQKDTQKLLDCVQAAGQDVAKLERCASKFSP